MKYLGADAIGHSRRDRFAAIPTRDTVREIYRSRSCSRRQIVPRAWYGETGRSAIWWEG